MLATVLPITVMATTTTSEPEKDPAGLFDRTTIRGFVLFKRTVSGARTIRFLAVRLHYLTVNLLTGERESGLIKFQSVTIPNTLTGFYGKNYIFASFHGSLNQKQ